ncbi:hypothetical protein [Caldisericum exile]|uniref:Lipoprotein n=1 Tax=Caldisericum exile (strain DSM 21853 / NBRC 104410 / AZM16c01) TaxID=511051 RepID=A0A7U6GD23_CALEA|nr:hypothetical protein [Caldisericum exile]BAL80192.1 hypothetical protein CSE_00660 [Caldisericum exile AZM16c01]
MKKKIHRIITLLVGMAVLFAITGCSNNPQSNNQNNALPNTNQSTVTLQNLVKGNEIVNQAKLKYESIDIPKDYPSVASIAVSGSVIFFSSGSDRPSKNTVPCLTYIEKLFSYDYENKVLKTFAEIDNSFVQIDWVNVNDNWIVYREIEEEFDGPVRVYAINRKTNEKKIVYEENGCTDCEGVLRYNSLSSLVLYKDFLAIARYSFEPTERDKEGKIIDGVAHNSVDLINLNSGNIKTIFKKDSSFKVNGSIMSLTANASYLAFNYAKNGVQDIYVYDYLSDKLTDLLSVPLAKDASGSPNYIATKVLLTEDDNIIFDYPIDSNQNKFVKVIAPVSNMQNMKYFTDTTDEFYFTFPQTESKGYVVWLNRHNDTLNVLNRNTGIVKTCFVKDPLALGYIYLRDDMLFGAGKSLIILDLKENGF